MRSAQLAGLALAAVAFVAASMSVPPAEAAGRAPVPSATGARATIALTVGDGLNASTWNSGSFQIVNTSTGGERIARLRIDLRTALLPDLVFDPLGQAGDTVAKCLDVDSDPAAVGMVPPGNVCASPFTGPHDGGYDQLEIGFTGFDPGRTFSFSVDVDPTSIKGSPAPGPAESGSVSGLELTGSSFEVTFSDGSVMVAQPYRSPGSDGGSQAAAMAGLPPAPGIQVVGLASTPATVPSPDQTVRVSGPPGSQVALLHVEAGLYTTGLPGGEFDVDPFEANSVVGVAELAAALGGSGIADIPVTLRRSSADSGLNYFVAVLKDALGRTGPPSSVLVLVPEDCSAPPLRSVTLALAGDVITWTMLPGATHYDLVRGGLRALLSQGDFSAAVGDCLADQDSSRQFVDSSLPAPGDGLFYLVRGGNCGGEGTYDSGGPAQLQSRDAGIAASVGACP
jgi:hypothetical protein